MRSSATSPDMAIRSAKTKNISLLLNLYLIPAEYHGQERSEKYLNIMNTLLEKILTERSARDPEEIQTFAIAQNSFESWE
jgi:uncharacterized membrane protein YgaE (UPF0421/DUF939 family)